MAAATASVSCGLLHADHDGCRLDGRLLARDEWPTVIAAGRLADVTGSFALAWRAPDGGLCLARDGIGGRSLFYAQTGDGLVFAPRLSDLPVPRNLNPAAVATYLTWAYLPGRETLLQNVYKVLPGEIIRFQCGMLARESFWRLPAEPESFADEDTLRARLRAGLEAAVRRCLPPGEPVGATLSGGIDSSLIVALASQLHDAPVTAWSVSFGEGYANELPFSSRVARHCGVEQRVVEISPEAVVRHLDDSIALLSDPIGDPLTAPNVLLFRAAAESGVGVVLNGEGGDPCFGGPKNAPMLLAQLYDRGADPYARERAYLRAHQKCYDELDVMLTPEVRAALPPDGLEKWLAPHFDDPRWTTFVNKLMALNVRFKGPHHILAKVDWTSAPFGVRPRSPLFDRAVVELAFAIPPQLKLRGTVEKYLLKEAVRDLLPAEILERPKSGMLVPVHAWFQGPLLPVARERLLDGLAAWNLIRRDYLERLLAGRLPGVRPRRGVKIWLLLTLEAWLRETLLRASETVSDPARRSPLERAGPR